MTWQDAMIAFWQFAFAAALIPTILARFKPAPWTCWLTAVGLTAVGVTFGTLGLWLSMAGILAAAAGWWVLVWQVRR